MEYVLGVVMGVGIFFLGIVTGYSLKGGDTEERLEAVENEIDALNGEFAPAVARSIEAIAGDIKRLSDNDGELIDAYRSVSGRLAAWVTQTQPKQ
jgi:hypothetical protein